MQKSIYKITNLINGKSYIGQTTNPKRRFAEHRAKGYGQENNKVLYYAFDKYGIENFSFEVIEENVKNYNEREKFWIRYYDTYENGYNQTEGGENPPLHVKENSPFATHSQKQVDKVIKLILNTNQTLMEISKNTGYDYSTIKRINAGRLWHDDKLNYPLRKENSSAFKKDRANAIIEDLLNTKLSHRAIAEKYDCAKSTVTMINIGKHFKKENLSYPLRKHQ